MTYNTLYYRIVKVGFHMGIKVEINQSLPVLQWCAKIPRITARLWLYDLQHIGANMIDQLGLASDEQHHQIMDHDTLSKMFVSIK
jgi:hypothetical protein